MSGPQIVQCRNCQPWLGIAVRSNFSAFASEYVPGAGFVVPPADGSSTTIAELLMSPGRGLPGMDCGTTNTGVMVICPAAASFSGFSDMIISFVLPLCEIIQFWNACVESAVAVTVRAVANGCVVVPDGWVVPPVAAAMFTVACLFSTDCGTRTLSITWITPFVASMFAVVTLASFIITSSPSWTVNVSPSRVVRA